MKLEQLNLSNFEKFEEKKLSNLSTLLGGKILDTKSTTTGACDKIDTETDDGHTLDGKPCDRDVC